MNTTIVNIIETNIIIKYDNNTLKTDQIDVSNAA